MKALIGMSGGVDSSVAALLMQQMGFECIGATMRLCPDAAVCGGADDAEDARMVADRLGIEHHVFDLRQDFDHLVVDRFTASYLGGATPNPCILCNRHLKFGLLLQKAKELGCDVIVSGHYARVMQDRDTGRYLLLRARDADKDQTYFLSSLDQEQLSHIRFPLGELTKLQVRRIAEENGFGNARKRDSQDICFIPDGDYGAFLAARLGKPLPEGDFLDRDGNVLGRHRGMACYTIGQRKGLGLAMGEPVYVCNKDPKANTVTVAPNDALFSCGLRANEWSWFPFSELTESMPVRAKIRHSRHDCPAVVIPEKDGFARVTFEEPQRAVSPGQAVVLYRGDSVVGGGTITEAIREAPEM